MVAMGSTDTAWLTWGVGRILMVAPAVVAVDVTLVASVTTDVSDDPSVTSRVLVLSTLVTSESRVVCAPLGSRPVMGLRVSARFCTGRALSTCDTTVLADRPRRSTAPLPMATGRPLLTEAVASEQATPTSMIDEAGAGRAIGAHVRGELAVWPSPVASTWAGA